EHGGDASAARAFVLVALALGLALFDFGNVAKALDAFRELDEGAEIGCARNFAANHVADFVLGEPVSPDIVHLLDTEREAAILRIHFQHFGLHRVALFEAIARMLDALGPADVADVAQAFHALFDFNECAEIRKITDAAGDDCAHRILFGGCAPRVGESLLQAERNPALVCFDVEDYHFHFFAHLHDFRRMLGPLRPAHFADVDEAFDARLDLNEGAVIGDADNFSLDTRSGREAFRHGGPRVGQKLLAAEGNALLVFVEFQYLNLNFFAGLNHGRRVRNAAPDQVADVKQAVQSAQVNEDAIVGDIFHFSGDDRAFGEGGDQRIALGFLIILENHAAADHHVAALAIQLENAELDFAVLPSVESMNGAKLNLRCGQKRAHSDIHHQAALDTFGDFAGDIRMLAIGFLDALPDAALVRAHMREKDVAIFLFVEALDFDGLPRAELDGATRVEKFLRRDQAFEFSADVNHHACVCDREDAAIENFSFGCGRGGRRELIEELIHSFGHLGRVG